MAGSLRVARQQILAFRRRSGSLDERLPKRAESLRRAAWAGLQDSMPRAALLSLHARVEGVEPSTWEHPSLTQAVGPSLPGLRGREAGLPAVHARAASRGREGPSPGTADGGAAPRASRQQADDRPRARRAPSDRQRAQVRDDDRHARDPLGRRAGAGGLGGRGAGRSTPPTRAASWPGATSTSTGRRAPTCSRAGRGSRDARRPGPSPRSRARCFRSARRSARSGCSPRTSPSYARPRPPRRPRACCRAATRTSSSCRQPSASSWSRARTSANGSGRPVSGRARCSSTARSAAPGDGRAHAAGRALGTPLAGSARRGRGRGACPAASDRARDRGGLGEASCCRRAVPPSRSQRADSAISSAGSEPRWPATPSILTMQPGTCAASHLPCAGERARRSRRT